MSNKEAAIVEARLRAGKEGGAQRLVDYLLQEHKEDLDGDPEV